jgi:hypothetical protein
MLSEMKDEKSKKKSSKIVKPVKKAGSPFFILYF